jgi:hypothetical protein
MTWWWCLNHKRVEEGAGCGSTLRIGPYESAQEAATALKRVHKREAEEQAREDAEEKEKWGDKPGEGS